MNSLTNIDAPHWLWLSLVLFNFVIQLAHFRNSEHRWLFYAKKATTPLLLLGGLALLVIDSDAVPVVPVLLLAAMAIGEIGIEGSEVVEATSDLRQTQPHWTVTAAAVLFLLVNVVLGIVLLNRHYSAGRMALAVILGITFVMAMTAAILHTHPPTPALRPQILAYSAGVAVLATGAIAGFLASLPSQSSLGRLTIAAGILVASDSMVLWRLGANWNPNLALDRRKLLAFLSIILVLYYVYIALLISIGAPFSK